MPRSFSVATAVVTARAPQIMTREPITNEEAMGGVGMGQFAEDQRAPRESPHLVGVGERNAAADAEILGGELLKEIADDPHESAKEKPEEQVASLAGVEDRGLGSSVECEDQRDHGSQFADGEHSDERERIHPADVGLAIRDIHGSPEQAGTNGSKDAANRAVVRAACVNGAEAEHDGCGNNGERSENDLGDVLAAGALQLAEEEPAPEDADEGVGIPKWKGDGQADVANGKDGEGVGDCPEHAGENGDGNQVLVLGEIGEDLPRAFEQCRERSSAR